MTDSESAKKDGGDFEHACKLLLELRQALTTFKGHGMPGFKDRAEAYLVLTDTDIFLKKHFPDFKPE